MSPNAAEKNKTLEHPNISEWIANAIADTGCRVVYGGHGGALVPLVNAVCNHPDLTWVCARNEHDAATMAAAHAKMTGGLGVVIATSGPGATNLTTGLMEALLDRVSLLAITGLKPTAQLGYAEFQDVNQSRLFAGAGIEWSKDAASPHGVIPLLRDAVSTAVTRRTCAHLAIPVDIQAADSPLPIKQFCASHAELRLAPRAVDPKVIEETAASLVGISASSSLDAVKPPRRRPRNIIALGLRAVHGGEGMSKAVMELAEALNAPVLTRLHAKGLVDESHPLSFGVIGVHGKPGLEAAAMLISTADRIISIGVDDETLLVCNMAGLQIRKVVEIEPDAMGLTTRFRAEHTIVGPMVEICNALTAQVDLLTMKLNKKREIEVASSIKLSSSYANSSLEMAEILDSLEYMAHHSNDYAEHNAMTAYSGGHTSLRTRKRSVSRDSIIKVLGGKEGMPKNAEALWTIFHEGNWRSIAQVHDGLKFKCDEAYMEDENYCHPVSVLDALSVLRRDPETDDVSRDAAITVDVGDVTLWASLCLSLQADSRTLYSERLGTMGYALNAGVAAVLARAEPSGAVVLAGDGGFQMSLQELSAFQQYKRPGDKLLCIIFDNQVLGRVAFGFDDAKGCDLEGPDYVALAKAYGGDGVRLSSSREAYKVVKEALQVEGLFVIHVIVNPEVKADMATFKDSSLKVMNSG